MQPHSLPGGPGVPFSNPEVVAPVPSAQATVPQTVFASASSPGHSSVIDTSAIEVNQPGKAWRVIYDLLRAAEPGRIIHWEILGEALGKDATDLSQRSTVNQAVRRAVKELEEVDQRTARNVRGYGYKVISNGERLELAQKHQKRAVREVGLARRQVTNVDLAAMDPNTRKAFEMTALALGHQAQVMERLSIDQKNLETVMENVRAEQRQHAEDMGNLHNRLAALEARVAGGAAQPPGGAYPQYGHHQHQ